MSYSQNNEEEVILAHFGGKVGRFLDIGAGDGVSLSNTRALAWRWSGVCCEASPATLNELRTVYPPGSAVKVIPFAVTPETTGSAMLYEGVLISTLYPETMQKWGSRSEFVGVPVECVSLLWIFENTGYDFDFISIDVEGGSADLFRILPFERLTALRCICVEHDGHAVELAVLGERHGFYPRLLNQENLVLVKP